MEVEGSAGLQKAGDRQILRASLLVGGVPWKPELDIVTRKLTNHMPDVERRIVASIGSLPVVLGIEAEVAPGRVAVSAVRIDVWYQEPSVVPKKGFLRVEVRQEGREMAKHRWADRLICMAPADEADVSRPMTHGERLDRSVLARATDDLDVVRVVYRWCVQDGVDR
jgi:hypothetical protein